MALVTGSQPQVLEEKKPTCFQDFFLVNKVSLSADSSVKVTCQGLAIFLLSNLYHWAWHKALALPLLRTN